MAIAAVPDYLGNDFSTASPGLRFGMYFQGWTQDWKKYVPDQKNNKSPPVKSACKLNPNDKDSMASLLKRQQANFKAVSGSSNGLQLEAISISPFATGLGNEHPTENGFAFLNPYGLPYLPGSGIKGVLRQAARELASGEWGDTHGWRAEELYPLQADGKPVLDKNKNPVLLTMLDVLFGRETTDGDSNQFRGALTFWDVIPQIKDDHLAVEIMTPHYGHYYQPKKDERGNPIIVSPHDSGLPNPITFLTVPPGSGFTFHVQCNLALLQHSAAEPAQNEQWQQLLKAAFEHAFAWLGFGAKTAVGYGAMEKDRAKQAAREEELRQQQEVERKAGEQAERQQAIAAMNPVDKAIAEYLDSRNNKNQPEINALLKGLKDGTWSGELAKGIAEKLKAMMPEEEWREKSNKKNPDKDKKYVNTQLVIKYLQGE